MHTNVEIFRDIDVVKKKLREMLEIMVPFICFNQRNVDLEPQFFLRESRPAIMINSYHFGVALVTDWPY